MVQEIEGEGDFDFFPSIVIIAFNDNDINPKVLRGVEDLDMSTTVLGEKIDFP